MSPDTESQLINEFHSTFPGITSDPNEIPSTTNIELALLLKFDSVCDRRPTLCTLDRKWLMRNEEC